MAGLTRLYAKLKLRVNPAKSAVAPACDRSFLGYSFWVAPGKIVKRRVAPKALETDEGARPGDHVPERRTQPRAGRGAAAKLSAGMEGVLPSRRHARRVRGRGQMASPPTAHAHAQTVEARPNDVSRRCARGESPTRALGIGGRALSTLVARGGHTALSTLPSRRSTSTRSECRVLAPS